VTSPERQKEKKVVKQAAHSMADLNEESLSIHTGPSFLKIPGVIGRREREGFPCFPRSALRAGHPVNVSVTSPVSYL